MSKHPSAACNSRFDKVLSLLLANGAADRHATRPPPLEPFQFLLGLTRSVPEKRDGSSNCATDG